MEFNYFQEEAEFAELQRKMRKEYEKAGMSKQDIEAMCAYDWENFKNEIKYMKHTLFIEDYPFGENEEATYEDNVLAYLYPDSFKYYEDSCINSHIDWRDEDDMRKVALFVKSLTAKQREIYELYVYEGMDYLDIADYLGVTRSTVTDQMARIRKKFKKVF